MYREIGVLLTKLMSGYLTGAVYEDASTFL